MIFTGYYLSQILYRTVDEVRYPAHVLVSQLRCRLADTDCEVEVKHTALISRRISVGATDGIRLAWDRWTSMDFTLLHCNPPRPL